MGSLRLGFPGLRGPLQEAEGREGVLSWTPAPASAPERVPSRGDERETPGARGMERVWGKRKALRGARGCRRSRRARNIIQHTHTCWAICSAHSGASSSSRTPGRVTAQTQTHRHSSVHICEHRHTSRTPAPTGHSHQAQNLLRRLHDQQRGHTQPVAIDNYNTIGCDTRQCQTHKHNLVPSCTEMTASVRQMNAPSLAPCTHR